MSETAEVMTSAVAANETDATKATNATDAAAEDSCVCRRLRTKKAFGSFHGNLYSWQSGDSTTAVYWCLRTMETVGPDDGYAHPHACLSGRDCFDPPE
jgi:hypothetical protein